MSGLITAILPISSLTVLNIASGMTLASGLYWVGGMIQMEYQNWKGLQPGSAQDQSEIAQLEHEAACFMASQRNRLQ